MKYSATCKDSRGEFQILENQEYPSLKAFRADLVRNGYRVYKHHIATSERYTYILEQTNGEDWHWRPNRKAYRETNALIKKFEEREGSINDNEFNGSVDY
jgi:hypothetical protein